MERLRSVLTLALGMIIGGLLMFFLQQPPAHGPIITGAPSEDEQELIRRALREPKDPSKAISVVVAAVRHAVVSIETERAGGPEFLRQLYERFPQLRPEGVGSGVIVDREGTILTNAHVVRGARRIWVRLASGSRVPAKLVGSDRQTDVAVIRIGKGDWAVAPLGDADQVQVGEIVVAMGSPFALEQTVTMGIISAKGRTRLGLVNRGRGYEDFLQTDAAINPGNSGGPLLNLQGEVIGINTAILSQTGGYQGISLAIPINLARGVAEQLIEKGEVSRGWLGVLLRDLSAEEKARLPGGGNRGVQVVRALADSPSDRAGVRAGDIIMTYRGQPVADASRLRLAVAETPADETVELDVVRDGKMQKFSVKIGER